MYSEPCDGPCRVPVNAAPQTGPDPPTLGEEGARLLKPDLTRRPGRTRYAPQAATEPRTS